MLLAGSAVCLLLPLIPVRVKVPTAYSLWLGSMVAEPIGTSSVAVTTAADVSTGVDAVQWPTIILAFYVIGAIVALIFYIRSYSAMFRLMKHYPGKHYEGFTLHLIDDSIPSFSWLRHIFIWRNDFERYPAIFTHEQAHVRCGHSIDLLLSSALTVFQSLPVDGIIIVSTPQDLVKMIVNKAYNMAKMMDIPVLGLIENMSYYECPDCGKKVSIFGESQIDQTANELALPVLAKLPINPENAKLVDEGRVEDIECEELDGLINALQIF